MADTDKLVGLYDSAYGHFGTDVYAEVRRETRGQEVGQSGWMTRDELERFAARLGLRGFVPPPGVGCGSGGPALHVARTTGCAVAGVDVNESGIETANRLAADGGLAERASFVRPDVRGPSVRRRLVRRHPLQRRRLPHRRPRGLLRRSGPRSPAGRPAALHRSDHRHRSDRQPRDRHPRVDRLLRVRPAGGERALARGGRPPDPRRRGLHGEHGLGRAAVGRGAGARGEKLREIEGDESFEGQQRFLETAARLAAERRLSRFTYLVERPG